MFIEVSTNAEIDNIFPDNIINADDYTVGKMRYYGADGRMKRIQSNTDFEYEINNGEVKILKYLGNNSALIIPDRIDGLPVTSIHTTKYLCKNIFIPASLVNMDWDIFADNELLEEILVDHDNPVFFSNNGVLYAKYEKCLIQYPAGKPDVSYAIPDGIVSICPTAFYTSATLFDIIIPDSIVEFGLCLLMDSKSAACHEFSKAWIVFGEFLDCIPNTVSNNPYGSIEAGEYKENIYNIFHNCKNIRIHCYKGTAAHQYAINNHIPFILIDV